MTNLNSILDKNREISLSTTAKEEIKDEKNINAIRQQWGQQATEFKEVVVDQKFQNDSKKLIDQAK